MSERLHPDGLPVSATPITRAACDWGGVEPDVAMAQERRAREAEAKVAELERELAWLRSGGELATVDISSPGHYYDGYDVEGHLASKPPEGWNP